MLMIITPVAECAFVQGISFFIFDAVALESVIAAPEFAAGQRDTFIA